MFIQCRGLWDVQRIQIFVMVGFMAKSSARIAFYKKNKKKSLLGQIKRKDFYVRVIKG